VKFPHDLASQDVDGGVAGDFTELMAAHAIRHHIQTKGYAGRISSQRGGNGDQAIFIMFALFAHRLTHRGGQLLSCNLCGLAVDNGFDLLVG